MSTVLRWIIDIVFTAIALWVVVWLVPGVEIAASTGTIDDAWVFLGVAAVFLVVNAVVKPVLEFIGLPLTCLTFGLFVLVINALTFMAAAWVSTQLGFGLFIDGFWPALFGSIVLALVRGALSLLRP